MWLRLAQVVGTHRHLYGGYDYFVLTFILSIAGKSNDTFFVSSACSNGVRLSAVHLSAWLTFVYHLHTNNSHLNVPNTHNVKAFTHWSISRKRLAHKAQKEIGEKEEKNSSAHIFSFQYAPLRISEVPPTSTRSVARNHNITYVLCAFTCTIYSEKA